MDTTAPCDNKGAMMYIVRYVPEEEGHSEEAATSTAMPPTAMSTEQETSKDGDNTQFDFDAFPPNPCT